MSDGCIQEVFRSIVIAKLAHASQAWSGFCTASDINKLDRFLQGVSVAASPVLATIGMSVCPSVCPSVCHTLALSENDAS